MKALAFTRRNGIRLRTRGTQTKLAAFLTSRHHCLPKPLINLAAPLTVIHRDPSQTRAQVRLRATAAGSLAHLLQTATTILPLPRLHVPCATTGALALATALQDLSPPKTCTKATAFCTPYHPNLRQPRTLIALRFHPDRPASSSLRTKPRLSFVERLH